MPLSVPGGGFFEGESVDRIKGENAGPIDAGANVYLMGTRAAQNNTGDRVICFGQDIADQNALDDIICIGYQTGPETLGTWEAEAGGAIFIGTNAGREMRTNGIVQAFHGGPNVVIGKEAVQFMVASTSAGDVSSGNVAVGYRAGYTGNYTTVENVSRYNTFIGARVGEEWTSVAQNNVVIGYLAHGESGSSANSGSTNTVIGAEAGREMVNSTGRNVLIGFRAGETCRGSQNTLIGYANSVSTSAGDQVLIVGTQSFVGNSCQNSITIGSFSDITGNSEGAILLGYRQDLPNNHAYSIVLGHTAGQSGNFPALRSFVVESVPTGLTALHAKPYLYGDLDNGNLILGNHTDGTSTPLNRDMSGNNVLKLLDAASGSAAQVNSVPSANPSGGIFLYYDSAAGANGEFRCRFPNGTVATIAAA